MAKVDQKTVLIVIDGWGVATEKSRKDGDAILAADTPTMDEFAKDGSKTAQGYTELEASSLAVGLPEGLMGNSEVGHLNIGAGRVVWQHLIALLKVAKDQGVKEAYIHFFGDGRDTDPKSAVGYMETLLKATKEIGLGDIATVVGRYYIMDRDKRWDRVELGMKGLVTGEGEESSDPVATIKERYAKDENDEFLKPIIVGGKERRIQGILTC